MKDFPKTDELIERIKLKLEEDGKSLWAFNKELNEFLKHPISHANMCKWFTDKGRRFRPNSEYTLALLEWESNQKTETTQAHKAHETAKRRNLPARR